MNDLTFSLTFGGVATSPGAVGFVLLWGYVFFNGPGT